MAAAVRRKAEHVLAVPAAAAGDAGWAETGWYPLAEAADGPRLASLLRSGRFWPRGPRLERDPARRQVIPYLVAHHAGRVLVYQRSAAAGDSRLRRKLSLGLGGHWRSTDSAEVTPRLGLAAARCCARRESAEELGPGVTGPYHLLGVVSDLRDPVGRAHIGVVFRFDVEEPAAVVPEPALGLLGWHTPASSAALAGDWEGWSGLLAPHLDGLVSRRF